MKRFLLLSLIVLLQSCDSSTQGSRLELFNNTFFNLEKGEKEIILNSGIKESYFNYVDNSNVQIPLYKCVRSKDYMIYLGLPFNTSIERLKDERINIEDGEIKLSEMDTISSFKQYENEHFLISEYSKSFEKNLVYVLVVSNYDSKINPFLKTKDFSDRFTKVDK